MGISMPKLTNPLSGALADNNMRKLLEEKKKERSKIYGFIGMDVYDLHKQGKADFPELAVYFEKIEALEQELAELEAEKQSRELRGKKARICSCGQPLSEGSAFCSNCGKPVDNGIITCSCGNLIKSDLKFCPNCGKNLKENMENGGQQSMHEEQVYLECICGAKVPKGQFMCMECGRKVEG